MKPVDLPKPKPYRAIFSAPLLQRVLRKAKGHIDLAYLDAVGAGVTDNLRRCIKAHRLRIQQSAAECVGMIMLQPGRDVDQLRKARGVTFRKAIGAEPLD